jgi:hypothetical protein
VRGLSISSTFQDQPYTSWAAMVKFTHGAEKKEGGLSASPPSKDDTF